MTRLLDRGRSTSSGTPGDDGVDPLADHVADVLALFEDPRIAARRAAVDADGRAHRRRRAATFALGVAVVALVVGVLQSPLTSVRTVQVIGAERTDDVAVTRASGLSSSPPLVSLDVGSIARRIAALPWVATARVERDWPRTVRIRVTEREPVALLTATPGPGCATAPCLAAVDVTGRVLAVVDDAPVIAGLPTDLARVAGPARPAVPGLAVDAASLQAVAVAAGLPPALRPLVSRIEVDEQGEVGLRLSGQGRAPGALVRLGTADRMATKLTAAATVLDRVPRSGLTIVDVRVPEAPVLTRNNGTTTVSPSARG